MITNTAVTCYIDVLSVFRKLQESGIHYLPRRLVREVPSTFSLPLESYDFLNFKVYDFVVFFAGKAYPGKRIVNRAMGVNTCVYNWGDFCKVLVFIPVDSLMPFYEDFVPVEYEAKCPLKVISCCTVEGYPTGHQVEEFDAGLNEWSFSKVMEAHEVARVLHEWMKSHYSN